MTTEPFLSQIHKNPLLADGAMGSLLLEMGYTTQMCLAELNIKEPELIQKIHQDYISAGAQIIFTHTFAANYTQLKQHNLADKFHSINQQAVKNARRAAQDKVYVAGNIGPSGLVEDDYKQQTTTLIEQGIDLIALETFTKMDELQAALSACTSSIPADFPILASVSPREDGRLMDGTTLPEWSQFLDEQTVDVIGINCYSSPKTLKPLVENLRAQTKRPIALKVNAGLPVQKDKKWIYPIDSDEFCLLMKEVAHNNVVLIGGCCGTTPEYIEKLKQIL